MFGIDLPSSVISNQMSPSLNGLSGSGSGSSGPRKILFFPSAVFWAASPVSQASVISRSTDEMASSCSIRSDGSEYCAHFDLSTSLKSYVPASGTGPNVNPPPSSDEYAPGDDSPRSATKA